MREKILELIQKELENVGGENIFHECYQSAYYSYPNPIKQGRYLIKDNCDITQYIIPDLLCFTLKFEDGEPSIRVYSYSESESTSKLYKTKYIGIKKFWETNTSYKFITKITCGHISFDLSDEENNELLKLTKVSYEKYLSLMNEVKDKKVLDKLNKRLEKYGK
jgi:hypothetical protein